MTSRRPFRLAIMALCSALLTASVWNAAQAARLTAESAPKPPSSRFT